jgi:hypothetical protein
MERTKCEKNGEFTKEKLDIVVLMSQKQLFPGSKSHMPAVRPNEVGDISRSGIVCTFAGNRCDDLNSLAGTVATNLVLAKAAHSLLTSC